MPFNPKIFTAGHIVRCSEEFYPVFSCQIGIIISLEMSVLLDRIRNGITGLRVDLFVPSITFTPKIQLQWLLLIS